jgi:hypothetical protein
MTHIFLFQEEQDGTDWTSIEWSRTVQYSTVPCRIEYDGTGQKNQNKAAQKRGEMRGGKEK